MNKKLIPFLIGIPNLGVGILWAMNISLIPGLVSTITDSNKKLALLTSMGAFTGIFVQYLAGIISDRSHFKMGRRKPFMIIGSLLSTLFICMMPFTHSYALMFITAFLFYFSLNFYQGPYYSMIPEVVSEEQLGLANGFSKLISVLGSAVIFLFGPMLWEKKQYLPFFAAALLSLSAVIFMAVFVKEDPQKAKIPTKFSFDFIKNASAMNLFIGVLFIFLSYGCITPFFVKYCITSLDLTSAQANVGMLLLTVVGAAFAAPIGFLSDKIERRKVLMLGALIFAVGLTVATFVKSSLSIDIVLSVIGIGFVSMQVTIYAILAEIVPPERMGEYMGIMNLFISLGQFIANNIMGIFLDKYGYSVFFPIPAAIMFIAFLIIFFSRYKKYNVQDDSDLAKRS